MNARPGFFFIVNIFEGDVPTNVVIICRLFLFPALYRCCIKPVANIRFLGYIIARNVFKYYVLGRWWCFANQWTGFYMIGTSVMKDLILVETKFSVLLRGCFYLSFTVVWLVVDFAKSQCLEGQYSHPSYKNQNWFTLQIHWLVSTQSGH